MTRLTDDEKKGLLRLARSVIASKVGAESGEAYPQSISSFLGQPMGCFVSLHKKKALRGCIGIIEPVAPLIDGIRENAVNAAFRDPRFPPIENRELDEINIEISVLTSPELLAFSTPRDLLRQLKPGVHGVILTKGGRRSTFLPQVWKQLPEKERFLEQLCLKAGMKRDCWKDSGIEVQVYEVESFSERPSL
ncbi:AmmeMemoRadiSam system protein A [Desulfococcus sp.]|uniref:AmmeMemoRadiSam system protein A n=1 Tax=Desulfococcus sp. TaxID=2025834 RepID=UPI003593F0A5